MTRIALDLDRYVPYLIAATGKKLSSGASRVYRELFGIGIADWRILAILEAEPNITASRICNTIGLDKAATSRTLLNLKRKGYVQESKDHSKDRRSTIIQLTAIGRKVHDDLAKVALTREQILLEALTESETEKLIEYLQKLNGQVEKANSHSYIDKTIKLLHE